MQTSGSYVGTGHHSNVVGLSLVLIFRKEKGKDTIARCQYTFVLAKAASSRRGARPGEQKTHCALGIQVKLARDVDNNHFQKWE